MRFRLAALGLFATALSCGGGGAGPGGTAGTTGAAGTSATGGGGPGGTAVGGRGGDGGTAVGGSGVGGSAGTAGSVGGSGGVVGGSGGSVGGSGGSVGSGGVVGGSGGSGGSAGGGGLPACGGAPGGASPVGVVIVGSDDMPLMTSVAAAVTVTAIEPCSTVLCPNAAAGGQRFTLVSTEPRQWSLYLRNPAMPHDVIKVGDTFDLKVDASADATFYTTLNQTVALARGGNLIVFAADLARFYQPPVPQLAAFGVQIEDRGASCQSPIIGCSFRPHTARVMIGGQSVDLSNDQTAAVGGFQITNTTFIEYAGPSCDAKSLTQMAGFRIPGAGGTSGSGGTTGGSGGTAP